MKRLSLITLFFVLLAAGTAQAGRLYYENFDDQDVDQPGVGSTKVAIDWNAQDAVYGTDYTWTTGYDGTGSALLSLQKPGDTGADAYLRWAYGNNTWPSDEMYVSYRVRFPHTNSQFGNENIKGVYPRWHGTDAYVAVPTLHNFSGWISISVRGDDGVSRESSATISGANNIADGNWHRVEVYINFATGQVITKIDSVEVWNKIYGSIWSSPPQLNYLPIPYFDAEEDSDFTRAIDEIEVWDNMPAGGGDNPPSVDITTADPQNIESDSLSVAWNASDDNGISQCKWRIGGYVSDSFGTQDNTSPASTSGYSEGENTLYVGCEDTAGQWTNDLITVNYSPGGDFTNPVISITSHADGEESATQNITLSGTAFDNEGLDATTPITASCPNCDTVGAVTGSTSWSIPIALATVSVDLIYDRGTFDSADGWFSSGGFTISGGTATNDGTSNSSVQTPFDAVIGQTYRVYYEIVSYTSGSLYLSQWGFPGEGNSIPLTVSEGPHTVDILCAAEADLRFTGNIIGSIDNVQIRQLGAVNTITVTAHDTSGNTAEDSVSLSYKATLGTRSFSGALGGALH